MRDAIYLLGDPMNKLYLFFTVAILLFSKITFADIMPKSFHNSCKVSVYETMFKWLKGTDFYTVDNIEVTEGKIPTGQLAVFIKINFHDSKGCQDRKILGDCISLPDNVIAVRTQLSDCTGKTILSSQVIH